MNNESLPKGNIPFAWIAMLMHKLTVGLIQVVTNGAPGVVFLKAAGDFVFLSEDVLTAEAAKPNASQQITSTLALYQKAQAVPSEPYDPDSDLVVAFAPEVAPIEHLKATGKKAKVRAMLIRRGQKSTRLINLDEDQKEITRAALS